MSTETTATHIADATRVGEHFHHDSDPRGYVLVTRVDRIWNPYPVRSVVVSFDNGGSETYAAGEPLPVHPLDAAEAKA